MTGCGVYLIWLDIAVRQSRSTRWPANLPLTQVERPQPTVSWATTADSKLVSVRAQMKRAALGICLMERYQWGWWETDELTIRALGVTTGIWLQAWEGTGGTNAAGAIGRIARHQKMNGVITSSLALADLSKELLGLTCQDALRSDGVTWHYNCQPFSGLWSEGSSARRWRSGQTSSKLANQQSTVTSHIFSQIATVTYDGVNS
jgi:hypothetical protein